MVLTAVRARSLWPEEGGEMEGGTWGTDTQWLPQQQGGDQWWGEQRWESYHGNGWSGFLTWAGDAAVFSSSYLPGVGRFRHNITGVPILSPTFITYLISS